MGRHGLTLATGRQPPVPLYVVTDNAAQPPSEPTIDANQYDRGYDYTSYWQGRDYENAAEVAAIRTLIGHERFRNAADIGGGFGRLCLLLREYADKVTLTDPSQTQLDASASVLAGTDIQARRMQADRLGFADGELDLVTMVRVMHHLPDPTPSFAEIARVLATHGVAIIEVANSGHAVNRVRAMVNRTKLPTTPVPVNVDNSREDGQAPISFVNHNVSTVVGQLADAGLTLERKLSVSNLRSPRLKRYLPPAVLLTAERALQRPLAPLDFGPSMFLKLRKS